MTSDEIQHLTYDEAVALLPDGDSIHTFLDSGIALIGADWDRAKILALLRESDPGIEVTGPAAQRMGHGLPAPAPPGQDTQPLALLRAQPRYSPPAPDMFPALPGDAPAGPADRYGRPPRTPRPADAAMYTRTEDGPGLECGLCRWRRHADPAAQDAPYIFDALRESARAAGWRPDAVGRWICPKCQHSPLYWPLRAPRHSAPRVRQAKTDGWHVPPAVEFEFEIVAEQAALERLRASRARTAVISRGDGRFLTARIVTGGPAGEDYQGRRRAVTR